MFCVCFTELKMMIPVLLTQVVSCMVICLLSCPFASSACGWPSPDSGQSSIQGFGFNTNDLWLGQPTQEFTQISRNRDVYLVVLGLNRTNMNLSGPWEITSVPASEAASAHSAVGDHLGGGGRVHLPRPPAAAAPTGCVPFWDKAETVTSEDGLGADRQ